MDIRYINPADNKRLISRIYEESWKYAYSDIIPRPYLDSIPDGQWANKLDNPEWFTLVCIEDGKYVGTSSFCKSRFESYPDAGEVISIYFLPEYIGKGYGKKLLKTVLSELQKKGFNEVFLWVLEENNRARHFYENIGFVNSGDYRDDCIGGKDLKEIRYVYRYESK